MHQSKTALIVDDEAPLLRLMARVLERAGFAAWTAQDGVEALRIFREHAGEIGLVVLDVIHPPGAGAVDLLPALLAENPDLDVILTSGDALPDSLEKRLASVGGQFLRKPFAPKVLIAMLESGDGHGVVGTSSSTETKMTKKTKKKADHGLAQADSGAV